MTPDLQNIDVELQEWLGTQEDGDLLAAVVGRVEPLRG